MVELTVGQVAGLIALGIFIARVGSPTQITFIQGGLLRDKESAATLTVASRSLQSSYWPDILNTDAAQSRGVRKPILLSSLVATLVTFLCAVAGVLTPLGLYDALESSGSKMVLFSYAKDPSPFGDGTPPRSNLSFSRTCSMGHGMLQGPAPCPYSGTTVIFSWNGTTYSWDTPYGYNTTVPNTLREIFSSGTNGIKTTVSNHFDIDWRLYNYQQDKHKNNGSTLLIGDYRPIKSLLMDNNLQVVEGLVVDALDGGIGFRNHTIPTEFTHGATWTEDLLFVEPDTSCVSNNLSIQFSVMSANSSYDFSDIALVDEGGFYALNKTYPMYDHDDAQNNPDMRARAYKAAWLTNAWTAAFFNVTSISNPKTGSKSFDYLNSAPGKRFELGTSRFDDFSALELSRSFGKYIGKNDGTTNWPNPWNITSADFENIVISCQGATAMDFANATNIYVACGQMRGIPRRLNPGSPVVFESGSQWTTPLYSCASSLRATIKSVTFKLNGTSGLRDLHVMEIADKKYSDNATMPLWGFEETGLKLDGIIPIWGLIDDKYENYPNISSFRKPSLYLGGLSDPRFAQTLTSLARGDFEYMPGAKFGEIVMNTVYAMSSGTSYTGASSLAMFLKWQNYSMTPEGATRIIDLVWTDIASNAVVGTKGTLGVGNSGNPDELVRVTVQPIRRKIKYKLPYAIPAFILAAILLLIGGATIMSAVLGKSSIGTLRRRLNQSSAGRLIVASLEPNQDTWNLPSKEWSKEYGSMEIDMNGTNDLSAADHADSKVEGNGDLKGLQMSATPMSS